MGGKNLTSIATGTVAGASLGTIIALNVMTTNSVQYNSMFVGEAALWGGVIELVRNPNPPKNGVLQENLGYALHQVAVGAAKGALAGVAAGMAASSMGQRGWYLSPITLGIAGAVTGAIVETKSYITMPSREDIEIQELRQLGYIPPDNS